MFTGIIKHFGKIVTVLSAADGTELVIEVDPELLTNIAIGDSVAVNGCCLTLAAKPTSNLARFELGPQTVSRVAAFREGILVHLETAVRANDLLGGHIVTGHVDGKTQLRNWQRTGDSALATFSIPKQLDSRLIAPQGSVALAGVSLTVVSTTPDLFAVQLIPHTLANTLLTPDAALGDNSWCNFEADCMARYALRAVTPVLESQTNK